MALLKVFVPVQVLFVPNMEEPAIPEYPEYPDVPVEPVEPVAPL